MDSTRALALCVVDGVFGLWRVITDACPRSLLGEMQVRHYSQFIESGSIASDRLVRCAAPEAPSMLQRVKVSFRT